MEALVGIVSFSNFALVLETEVEDIFPCPCLEDEEAFVLAVDENEEGFSSDSSNDGPEVQVLVCKRRR